MEEENWKDVIGFEGLYQISNLGSLKSYNKSFKLAHGGLCVTKGRDLKFTIRSGYCLVILRRDKKRYTYSVHRLVADHFTTNPENKPQINHKNGIKTDNRIGNLEWVTRSENVIHSYLVLKRKASRTTGSLNKIPVSQKTLSGEFIKKFSSITKASNYTGIKRHQISWCLNGKRKSVNGFLWE